MQLLMPENYSALPNQPNKNYLVISKEQGLLNKKKPLQVFRIFPSPALPGAGTMGISQLMKVVKHPILKTCNIYSKNRARTGGLWIISLVM